MAVFVYIDETGTTSLDDKKQPVLTLVAALVPEHQVQPLSSSLRDIALSSLGWLPPGLELHGHEIWGGTGAWSDIDAPGRIAAYRAALALLEQHEVSIAYASINKPKLKARYNEPDSPYLIALQFLCQKVNAVQPQSLKVLVADESREHELRAINMVADMQEWGTGVVHGPKLASIIDTLHFVRSQSSPGVQMADLVAFIMQRHRRDQERHPNAARALRELFSMIDDATVTWRQEWPSG